MLPAASDSRPRINGVRLWTDVRGDGPGCILCHGGPGLPDYLDSLAPLLPGRVVRFEQRGCGRSNDREPSDLAAHIADIDALRQHYGFERFVVAGHSWGADLALLYAMHHPDRVSRLLYICGTGIEDGWQADHRTETHSRLTPLERRRLDELHRCSAKASSDDERDRITIEILRLTLPVETERAEVRQRLPQITAGVNSRANRRLNREWHEWIERGELAARTGSCTAPSLLVQGARDPRPTWPARNLAALLPDSRYRELADAGHFPWLDQPNDFLGLVTPFLLTADG